MPIKKEDFPNVWMFWLTDKTRLLGQLRKLCRGGQSHLHSIQLNIQTIPSVFCSLCYVCLYSPLTGSQICVFLILDRREITSPGRRFILSVTAFALAFGKVIISAFDVAHKLSFFVWVPNCPRTFSPQCNVSVWNSMCSLKTLSEVMYLPHKSQSKCVERESRRNVALWGFHINL